MNAVMFNANVGWEQGCDQMLQPDKVDSCTLLDRCGADRWELWNKLK